MAQDFLKTVVTARESSGTGDGGVISNSAVDQVIALQWWQIILIRAARAFVGSLIGVGGTAGAASIFLPGTGQNFKVVLMTAAACAGGSILLNAFELLAKLDVKHPTLRA
jgi:hypothetical protein